MKCCLFNENGVMKIHLIFTEIFIFLSSEGSIVECHLSAGRKLFPGHTKFVKNRFILF